MIFMGACRETAAKFLIGSLLVTTACAQPFQVQTNTVIAPVNGKFWFTQDGTNWIPVVANTVRFEIVETNAPPIEESPGIRTIQWPPSALGAYATSSIVALPAITNIESKTVTNSLDPVEQQKIVDLFNQKDAK